MQQLHTDVHVCLQVIECNVRTYIFLVYHHLYIWSSSHPVEQLISVFHLYLTSFLHNTGSSGYSTIPGYHNATWNLWYSFIHSFIQAISIAPLQVCYYSEALPTQHGYCAGVSRWSATVNCELRTCQAPYLDQDSNTRHSGQKASTQPRRHLIIITMVHHRLLNLNQGIHASCDTSSLSFGLKIILFRFDHTCTSSAQDHLCWALLARHHLNKLLLTNYQPTNYEIEACCSEHKYNNNKLQLIYKSTNTIPYMVVRQNTYTYLQTDLGVYGTSSTYL